MPAALEAPAASATAPAAPAPAAAVNPNSPGPSQANIKSGSAKARMNQALEKRFAGESAPEPAKAPATAPDTTEEAPRPGAEPSETEAPAKVPAEAAPAAAPTAPEGKAKVSPWKLVDEWKGKAAALEKQLAEAKTSTLAEKEKAEYLTRIEKAEARLKEHEEELKFTNYQKSAEFQEKYQKPYEANWKRAMGELQGLQVPTEDGNGRAFNAQDMLQLVNMDLIPARKLATDLYGDFATDVMLHRNEIRRMADEQNDALADAKANGVKRDTERAEMQTKTQREISEQTSATFKAAHEAAAKDEQNGRFFTPKEGDDEWNTALENGRKLSASVFTEDPSNPKLTPTERAAIVKRHAAVFNRSAAYGPMKRLVARLEAQVKALTDENSKFKGSAPDAAASRGQTANGNGAHVSAKDRVFGALSQLGSR